MVSPRFLPFCAQPSCVHMNLSNPSQSCQSWVEAPQKQNGKRLLVKRKHRKTMNKNMKKISCQHLSNAAEESHSFPRFSSVAIRFCLALLEWPNAAEGFEQSLAVSVARQRRSYVPTLYLGRWLCLRATIQNTENITVIWKYILIIRFHMVS